MKKFLGSLSLMAMLALGLNAQNNLGSACGCPAVSARTTTVNLSTLADANGNLTAANTILTCDKLYILDRQIYVGDGKSLTINAGVVVKGVKSTTTPPAQSNGGALIVSRGAKIFATGTELCPIVFTASDDPMDGTYPLTNKGKWGGIIVLGKAKNNITTSNGLNAAAPSNVNGVGRIEGFTTPEPRIYYGAGDALFPNFDDNDNSGIMTYVSIRHGGEVIGANNEINGLTLGSVGRGTTLHHIEVVSNLDDGIEFFGGTVDLKYASVLFNDDDGFDWDQNWSGRGQFWVTVKTDQTTATGGDNGYESDGDDDKINSANPSNPLVYNTTMIGSKGINANTGDGGGGAAIRAKENTFGTIRNSIFANYRRGLRLDNDNTIPGGGNDAYDNWNNGNFKVECNTFVNVTDPLLQGTTPITTGADLTKFTNDGNVAVASLSGFSPAHTITTANLTTLQHDITPSPNVTSSCTAAPVDGFFTPASYRGAFDTAQKSWLSNYSVNALVALQKGFAPCPDDVNNTGNIDLDDLLQVLGTVGGSCN